MTNWLRNLLTVAALIVVAGCAVQVAESKRLKPIASKPEGVTFIWSASKAPSFSNLPALGVLMASYANMLSGANLKYFESYLAEHRSFGRSLESTLPGEPLFRQTARVIALPPGHSAAQLQDEIHRAQRGSAVVVLYPERVVSYCAPGCYAFKVRITYLAPIDRSEVWSALFDLPPKVKHGDSFDSVTGDFAKVLAEKMKAEQLLP